MFIYEKSCVMSEVDVEIGLFSIKLFNIRIVGYCDCLRDMITNIKFFFCRTKVQMDLQSLENTILLNHRRLAGGGESVAGYFRSIVYASASIPR